MSGSAHVLDVDIFHVAMVESTFNNDLKLLCVLLTVLDLMGRLVIEKCQDDKQELTGHRHWRS